MNINKYWEPLREKLGVKTIILFGLGTLTVIIALIVAPIILTQNAKITAPSHDEIISEAKQTIETAKSQMDDVKHFNYRLGKKLQKPVDELQKSLDAGAKDSEISLQTATLRTAVNNHMKNDTISGKGDAVIDLPGSNAFIGMYVTYKGTGQFKLLNQTARDETGEVVYFVNTTGPYEGVVSTGVAPALQIKVSAEGDWEINFINPLDKKDVMLSFENQDVYKMSTSDFFAAASGSILKYSGNGNLKIYEIYKMSSNPDKLISKITTGKLVYDSNGPAEIPLRSSNSDDGFMLYQVYADGDWSIEKGGTQ